MRLSFFSAAGKRKTLQPVDPKKFAGVFKIRIEIVQLNEITYILDFYFQIVGLFRTIIIGVVTWTFKI